MNTVDASQFIGKDLKSAKKLAKELNLDWRVTKEDGKSSMVTQDLRIDRINFELMKGIVVNAAIG